MDWLEIYPQHDHGAERLLIENCEAGSKFEMRRANIGEVDFRNSRFLRVDARKIKATRVTLQGVSGDFDFFTPDIEVFSATACTFNHPADAEDRPSGLGLCVTWINAQSVTLDRCKFEGRYARLFASGAKPDRDSEGQVVFNVDKKTGEKINPFSQIKTLAIRNTPIVHGAFAYAHIGDFQVDGEKIADTTFAESRIGELALRNVQLSGSLDFSDTQVTETIVENVTRDKLSIVKDKTTKLELSGLSDGGLLPGVGKKWFS